MPIEHCFAGVNPQRVEDDTRFAQPLGELGYWSDDLEADSQRLTQADYVWEATYHNPDLAGPFGFTYHTLPATGLRVELVDRGRKPAFDGWMAGGDFPSALDAR